MSVFLVSSPNFKLCQTTSSSWPVRRRHPRAPAYQVYDHEASKQNDAWGASPQQFVMFQTPWSTIGEYLYAGYIPAMSTLYMLFLGFGIRMKLSKFSFGQFGVWSEDRGVIVACQIYSLGWILVQQYGHRQNYRKTMVKCPGTNRVLPGQPPND